MWNVAEDGIGVPDENVKVLPLSPPLKKGDNVIAVVDIPEREIRAGEKGRIKRIDKEGDAKIKFEGDEKSKWVYKKNLRHLKIWMGI